MSESANIINKLKEFDLFASDLKAKGMCAFCGVIRPELGDFCTIACKESHDGIRALIESGSEKPFEDFVTPIVTHLSKAIR